MRRLAAAEVAAVFLAAQFGWAASSAGAVSPAKIQCTALMAKKAPTLGDEIKVGQLVEDGAAAVAIQRPGVTATANVLDVDGIAELTIGTTDAGQIVVEGCGSDLSEEENSDTDALVDELGSPVATASASPGECVDTAYDLSPWHWASTYQWYFKESTTPSGLSEINVANALENGTQSITAVRNTCGMADNVPITQQYLGNTSNWANINSSSACTSSTDGLNVTDFAGGTHLAVTCTWFSNGVANQSDARFNKSSYDWMPTAGGNCGGRYVIRAVAAHERGHTFGLAHVGEGSHGRLTMSELIDGACQEQEYWLGRGDVLGVRARYGV